MSVAFQKFNSYVQDVGQGKINLNADTLMILLTNTSPNAADTVVDTTTTPCTVKSTSNAVEIAAGNGYTKGGGQIVSNAYTQVAGLASLTGNAVTITATGSVGPFRYAVAYDNSSGTTATRSVIGFWDNGSSVTLASGQSVIIGNSSTGGNWTTSFPILTDQ
jgi:hypothetical protein